MGKGSFSPAVASRSFTVKSTNRDTCQTATDSVADHGAEVDPFAAPPEFDHEDPGLNSKAGVTLAYRMARGYCSIEMMASVTVPCLPGAEAVALEYSKAVAGQFITDNRGMVEATLREVIGTAENLG